jgi:hypothetical protein
MSIDPVSKKPTCGKCNLKTSTKSNKAQGKKAEKKMEEDESSSIEDAIEERACNYRGELEERAKTPEEPSRIREIHGRYCLRGNVRFSRHKKVLEGYIEVACEDRKVPLFVLYNQIKEIKLSETETRYQTEVTMGKMCRRCSSNGNACVFFIYKESELEEYKRLKSRKENKKISS